MENICQKKFKIYFEEILTMRSFCCKHDVLIYNVPFVAEYRLSIKKMQVPVSPRPKTILSARSEVILGKFYSYFLLLRRYNFSDHKM